jgi:undecaprenyl-diphosphatase
MVSWGDMSPIQHIAVIFAKYVIFLVVAIAGAWFLWKLPKEQRKSALLFGAIALPVAYLCAVIASKLYYDPRPFMNGGVPSLIPHAPGNGFPSDHTLLSAAVAAVVWVYSRRVGLVLFGLALLIGLSRVYAGVHHLADIIGAIVIAILATWLVHYLLERTKRFTKAQPSTNL